MSGLCACVCMSACGEAVCVVGGLCVWFSEPGSALSSPMTGQRKSCPTAQPPWVEGGPRSRHLGKGVGVSMLFCCGSMFDGDLACHSLLDMFISKIPATMRI